jgi:ribonuclease P protein component
VANNRFGKNFRLLSNADFQYLKKGSQVSRHGSIRAYYRTSRLDRSETRIGISIPKKAGKGIIRNRIKRLIREKFRLSIYRTLGLDIIFVVSSSVKLTKGDREQENDLIQSVLSILEHVSRSLNNNRKDNE